MSAQSTVDAPKYAQFRRRLRGSLIDFMLFLVALVIVLQITVAFNSSDLSRVIGFGFVAGFFLYEPLLVSFAGGTIGHYLSNLRVVDDRTHGNVGILKAFARVAIKTGLLSRACLGSSSYCSSGDILLMSVLGLAWIVSIALCIGWGWRGRLWGARIRT
jgi:hypothetical protein